MTPIRITEADIDPARFFSGYLKGIAEQRAKELQALKLDEIQSSRGWIGYELPACTWYPNYKNSQDVANWEAWPKFFPGMAVKVVVGGKNTCMIKRTALRSLDEVVWKKLLKTIKGLQDDYGVLSDDIHSDVQSDGQDEAWNMDIWKEFGELMQKKFEGAFITWYGDPAPQAEFNQAMTDKDRVDDLFSALHREYPSDVTWEELDNGNWSLDVSEMFKYVDSESIKAWMWPEDTRQQFNFESLAHRVVNRLLEWGDPLESSYYDLGERRDKQLYQLAMELKASGGKGHVSWPVVPAARLKRIWLDYGKTKARAVSMGDNSGGIVRDEKGMDRIADQVMDLIARLQASTEMMGHTQLDVRPELNDMFELEFTDEEWDQWMSDYFTNEFGSWMLSDYGLPRLVAIYPRIYNATTAEEKLEAVDAALNVVHQRSDLASMFVEGGSKTLDQIFSQGGYTTPPAENPRARRRQSEGLNEDEGPHDYSCVMIDLPKDLAEHVIRWGKQQISNDILYVDKDGGCGREEEIHVTVKYGLTAASPDDRLLDIFKRIKGFEIKLAPISLFKQDDHDVVKMDIISPHLMALNRDVCAAAEAPGDSHPEYHAHVTIAYVKPGTCDRLEGMSPFDDPVKFGVSSIGKDGTFTADEVVFSSTDGSKTKYDLGHPKLDAKLAEESASWSPGQIENLLEQSPLSLRS
jgi:2'-5' RNA ligase